MDNVTHTLFGLCLSKAGLERTTPLATSALVIASNLPDLDTVTRLGGALSNLEYHRGLTHSLFGLAVLAVCLTFGLVFLDNRFRTRDPFRRPIRPWRVFWLAYLGGLCHVFMDFTNSYGLRPLIPFSDRWFYGDMVFIADPWIWLILGSAAVWLTATKPMRIVAWLAVGTALGLAVVYFREPPGMLLVPPPRISSVVRVIWFTGLGIVILGGIFGWRRAGPKLARYALIFLSLYYGGMWLARQSAVDRVRDSLPKDQVVSLSVWPAPGNPLHWQGVVKTKDALYERNVSLGGESGPPQWIALPLLDPRFLEALQQSRNVRVFLDFARYVSAEVEERPEGYTLLLRDPRFPLRMNVRLNSELAVEGAEFHWF